MKCVLLAVVKFYYHSPGIFIVLGSGILSATKVSFSKQLKLKLKKLMASAMRDVISTAILVYYLCGTNKMHEERPTSPALHQTAPIIKIDGESESNASSVGSHVSNLTAILHMPMDALPLPIIQSDGKLSTNNIHLLTPHQDRRRKSFDSRSEKVHFPAHEKLPDIDC